MTREKLLKDLIRDKYLKTPIIAEAFRAIDRLNFVPEEIQELAYTNQALPIGYGQTISQPLTVAFMLELLEPRKGSKILDIGSGSGWQAALLAFIVGRKGKVITLERIPELKAMTEKNAEKYGFIKKKIIESFLADGALGYEPAAPYDKIIAAAASVSIPEAWKKQLKIGGAIVAPVNNSIVKLEKASSSKFEKSEFWGFNFVPLISDFENPSSSVIHRYPLTT